MSKNDLPEWDRVLSAAAHLQRIIPDAVLVGGTAAAAHAGHRLSRDADHVLPDLRSRFDQILAELESVSGWQTARINRPIQILGSLDGIETGIRQLIRQEPLETMQIDYMGLKITLPTEAEMLRIKASLILRRNTTRDYLDFAAMAERLGDRAAATAMSRFDALYPQPNGQSPLQQLLAQLGNPLPYDLEGTNLAEYKQLSGRWHDWQQVKDVCARCAGAILDLLAGGDSKT
jgi:hypothetical protein